MVKISYATWLGTEGLKEHLLHTHLPVQRNDEGSSWYVFTVDGGVIHETRILKDAGEEQTDFEASFSNLTAPLTLRSALNKPPRSTASSQPENSTERRKGFQLCLATAELTGELTIGFDNLVYLRGGVIYSDSCSNKDYLNVDIIWKAYPDMIIVENYLNTIYMNKIVPVSFLSAECMEFPEMLALKVTYHKFDDGKERVISAMADYFEPPTF